MTNTSPGSTGAQLAHDKIDRYQSLGAFGKPVYQSHVQLRAMLLGKRGARLANYFAKPTPDAELGEIRWTTEAAGPVRAWDEMSPDEQATRALDLELIRSELMGFAQELRNEAQGRPGGAASFASLLEQALKVPASRNFLFFAGDQPVIAFWGFEDLDGRSVDPAAVAPRYPASGKPTLQAGAPTAPQAAAPVIDAGATMVERPWWKRWPWWLLLGLILLGLLLFFMRGCTSPVPIIGVPPGGASSPEPGALPDANAPGGRGDAVLPGGPGGAGGGVGGAGVGGGADGSGDGAGTGAPDGAGGSPDAGPDKNGNPPPEPPAGQDPNTNPPGVPPPDAAKPPGDDKAPPDKPQPDQGKPPATDPPPLPPPGAKDLKLPDDPKSAKDLKFMEGDWKAGDGLADKDTKQPLDLSMKFGKDGKGQMTLRRPDGTTCSGAVTGTVDAGKLNIQGSGSVPCSGGGSYAPPKIECSRGADGRTACYGRNPDGSPYTMDIQRQ